MVLGILVSRVHGGGSSNHAFALFSVAYGAAMFVMNMFLGGAPRVQMDAVGTVLLAFDTFLVLAAAAGLAWLGSSVAKGPGRRAHLLVASAFVVLYFVGSRARIVEDGRVLDATVLIALLSFGLAQAMMWGLSILCALRLPGAPKTNATGYALMGAAMAVYPAFWAGIQFAVRADRDDLATAAGFFLAWVLPAFVVSVFWLAAGAMTQGARARMARRVAWVCLGMVLAGLLAAPFAVDTEHWGYGASRILAVGLLAFAIVRGQAPGIDAKLRLGVSRSTIAAAFVAAFFLASEGAQLAFGRTNPLIGLLAAGLLVFALAPLQRAAERIAQRAVPSGSGGAGGAKRDASDAYRHGLRAAMRDGTLTRREEKHLAELARALGLDSVQALALREEVEREGT